MKFFALTRTDGNGRYTIMMKKPGTYYVVQSRTLGDRHQQYAGNRSTTGTYTGPMTVAAGDNIIMQDMAVYPAY